VRLRFVQKVDKDRAPLRNGTIDLETAVVDETTGPEIRTRALFQDKYIAVVRAGHALSRGKITPARYSSGMHILTSRESLDKGPLDDALGSLGLARKIVTIVGGFSAAIAFVRASDRIATVPEASASLDKCRCNHLTAWTHLSEKSLKQLQNHDVWVHASPAICSSRAPEIGR
jgi:DNA-binding transcriptional LysR family regulator